jgi:Pectate lyase superfamily protein
VPLPPLSLEIAILSQAKNAFATTTGILQDKGGQTYNIAVYGAKCDGATDDTAALQAAINAASSTGNGGTIFIPAGTCLISGAITIPYISTAAGATDLPRQVPFHITGVSSTANGYWNGLQNYGSVLDMRFAGDATHQAKFDTRGAGMLEIDNVVLADGGSDTLPFIFTTNTTLSIHNMAFSGTGHLQDAIILGATTTAYNQQNSTATAEFQGYGTDISNVFYNNLRRAVTFGQQANSVMVFNNTLSQNTGDASSTVGAPFFFYGNDYGNVIENGIIEVTNYTYVVAVTNLDGVTNYNNTFSNIGIWDDNGFTIGGYYLGVNGAYNMVYLGHMNSALPVFGGPSGGANGTQNTGQNDVVSDISGIPIVWYAANINNLTIHSGFVSQASSTVTGLLTLTTPLAITSGGTATTINQSINIPTFFS